MATYRYVAKDIEKDLKQLYDDAQISLASIAYWMHIVGDYYRRIRIEKYNAHQYLNIFNTNLTTSDDVGSFINVPPIYDYQLDKGIDFLEIQVGGVFVRCSYVTLAQLGRITKIPEEVPTNTNPVFYMVGHRAFVLPKQPQGTICNAGLYLAFETTKVINLDDEFEFPQDMLPRLKADLLSMGRLVLSMPDNAVNDGSAAPTQRGSLPNQPVTSPDSGNEAQ